MDNCKEDKILGIDAGGTFTDFAVVSAGSLSVENYTKIPTDKRNMVGTIVAGLSEILEKTERSSIKSVSIATTFATNALVEDRKRETGLILIGYDPNIVEAARRRSAFPTDRIIITAGGHDAKGNEKAALDESRLMPWLLENLPSVDSVAVSSFFSVRNPSHELRVKNLIESISKNKRVTCGHELTSDLDAVLRAVTVSLNANLIPIVMELFDSVEKVFKENDVSAPISVVKSDGTLVGIEWAKLHPIETILSGPAASSVGARHLSGAGNFARSSWVMDIGGTTTDIIYLGSDGLPVLKKEGATVGGHKTLIKTIDIYTFGLGGDSRVSGRGKDGRVVIGPKRVLPLCACRAEEAVKSFRGCSEKGMLEEPVIVFPFENKEAKNRFEREIIGKLDRGPQSAHELLRGERAPSLALKHLENMEERGMLSFSGFTLTDVLHCLGRLKKWDTEYSEVGAAMLAKHENMTVDAFCREVYETFVHHIAFNILCKSFERSGRDIRGNAALSAFVSDNIYNGSCCGSSVSFVLDGVLIGAGAPAWAFIEGVAAKLGCDYCLPQFSDVAGAVGAAVGIFSLNYTVWINPVSGKFRAHLPTDIKDFDSVDAAAAYTVEVMVPWLLTRSKSAGAVDPSIEYERKDEIVSSGNSKVHIWTEMIFRITDKAQLA